MYYICTILYSTQPRQRNMRYSTIRSVIVSAPTHPRLVSSSSYSTVRARSPFYRPSRKGRKESHKKAKRHKKNTRKAKERQRKRKIQRKKSPGRQWAPSRLNSKHRTVRLYCMCTVPYHVLYVYTVLYCTGWVQYSTPTMYYTAQHSIRKYCTVLYCTTTVHMDI